MSEVTNLDVKFLDAVSAGVTTDVAERIHHLAGNGEWQEDQEIEAQVLQQELLHFCHTLLALNLLVLFL